MKPTNEALGKASRTRRARPSTKPYWLRCASSAMTTMLPRPEISPASASNFWIVVKITPPCPRPSSRRRSPRLSARSGFWRSTPAQRANVPKSCSSRSLRSASTTTVGSRIAGSRAIAPAKNAIVRLLPAPCVCQITPIRRSPAAPSAPAPVRYTPPLLGDGALRLQAGRAQRLAHGRPHRVELVVSGRLLRQKPPVVLERDEAAHQIEETRALADALEQHAQLRRALVLDVLPRDRPPRAEPLETGRQHAQPRLGAVRDDEQFVERQQRRQVAPVGAELVPRRAQRGGLVRGVLQLDQAQRQFVDEEDDVGVPLRPADDGELVDGEPVVGIGALEVDGPDARSADRAPFVPVLDGRAFGEQRVELAVAAFEVRAVGCRQPPEGVVQRLGGRLRVERGERMAQPPPQHRVAVVLALRRDGARRDVGPVRRAPAEAGEPPHGGGLDLGFGDDRGGHGTAGPSGCRQKVKVYWMSATRTAA